MAENPIHYDDFIANVQPDPAKPEATIMLFGYVGHGTDGEVRVYPDPTLATWYDIPAADIVHSVPAPDAKLGGSYVWVRASAQIKPGSAAAAAAAVPAAAPAPEAAAAAPAAPPAAAPGFTIGQGCTFICAQPGVVHPTPTALPTPATHCFICPPRTIVTETCTPAVGCTFNIHCVHPTTTVLTTPATLCSPAVICNQPSPPLLCNQPSPPVICNIVASPNCPGPGPGTPVQVGPQQQFAAAAVQPQPQPTPTVQTHCFVCPPITLQAPCGHPTIPVVACWTHTVPPACPPHQTVGMFCTELCPSLVACVTHQVNCLVTQPQLCTIVASPNCPGPGPGTPVQTPQVQPQQAFAAALTQQNCLHTVQACPVNTLATICTQPPACPHRTFVDCTIIGCTHIGCPTQPLVCQHTGPIVCQHSLPIVCLPHTQPNICTIVASPNCPGPGPGTPVQTPQVQPQQQFAAAAVQPTPTASAVCTHPPACQLPTLPTPCPFCPTQQPICTHQPPCQVHTPPAPCPPPPTLPTVCTQPPACQIHTVQVGCPHPTLTPPCPSVGIACTVVNCPTARNICSETCVTLPVVCLPHTQPNICTIVASPNCPGPGPGTPVQVGPQQQFAAAAVPPQPTPTVQSHCFICPPLTQPPACQPQTHPFPCSETCHTLPVMCPSPPVVCTQAPGCQIHTVQPGCPHPTLVPPCPSIGIACTIVNCPTARNICSETCVTLPINCLQHTQPNICTIVASPNCPGPGPGTPVQTPQVGPQQQFAAAAGPQQLQPTPTVQTHCFICPPLTQPPQCPPVSVTLVVCCGIPSQPPACQPSVHAICPTPSAVHQCGQPSVNVICPTPSAVQHCGQPSVNIICPTPSAVQQCGTAATVCQPSVHVICPTPSAVQQCGTLQVQPNQPPSGTMHQCCGVQAGGFPTMQGCPPVTTNCMTTPPACGVFTPFGQQ